MVPGATVASVKLAAVAPETAEPSVPAAVERYHWRLTGAMPPVTELQVTAIWFGAVTPVATGVARPQER